MPQLSPRLTEMLDHFKQSKNYKKKQILYYEGSPMIGLYCLQSGKVKVYKTGAEGRQHILHLAEMAGTVAETAMRLLKEFREEKVLSVHGREIIITDQDRLKEVANLE